VGREHSRINIDAEDLYEFCEIVLLALKDRLPVALKSTAVICAWMSVFRVVVHEMTSQKYIFYRTTSDGPSVDLDKLKYVDSSNIDNSTSEFPDMQAQTARIEYSGRVLDNDDCGDKWLHVNILKPAFGVSPCLPSEDDVYEITSSKMDVLVSIE
jgi:hypothetical protein